VLGTFDLGYAVWEQMTLQQALRVGGQLALSLPTQTTLITAAINNAVPSTWALNPTVTGPCFGAPADCGGSCSTTPPAEQGDVYLQLQASRPFSALIVSSITTNTACYVVRVQ
jgi:hypothetical protein